MNIQNYYSAPDRLMTVAGKIIKATQDIFLGKVDRSKYVSKILAPYNYNKDLSKPQDYGAMVDAYKEWVYICANKNATTAASVPLRLYVAKKTSGSKLLRPTTAITKDNKTRLMNKAGIQHIVRKSADIEEVTEHDFLYLMNNVNPFMNRFMLWELTHLYLELTGNSYWWIVKNAQGVPAEIWVIPSQYMWIVPTADKYIAGYLYKHVNERVAFDYHEIIHFKYANPQNSYYGYSPLAAIVDAYNLNTKMNVYEQTIFANQGRPDGILSTDQEFLGKETIEKIHDEWEETFGSVSNQGKIAVLTASMKYTPLNFAPRELAFLKGREITREIIRNAYGQGEAMFIASSLASAEVADRAYRRDTINPRLTRIDEKLNEILIPMYNDPSIFVSFDNPIEQNVSEEREQTKFELEFGLTDINAERQKLGKDPYSIEEANVPMINNGRRAINAPAQGGYPMLSASEIAEKIANKMLEE